MLFIYVDKVDRMIFGCGRMDERLYKFTMVGT